MGGGGKKVTVGYKYYAGMHMILCHGPIDMLKKMFVDDKEAYTGVSGENQQAYINKPGLFGDSSREGGVVGYVDIEYGGPTQGANDYLAGQLVPTELTAMPAFRGVVGVVLRKVYLGVNPYLKKWSFNAQRVFTRQRGTEQWEPTLAPIIHIGDPVALYFALDFSGSMTGIKYNNLRLAMFDVLDALDLALTSEATAQIDIMLVGFGGEPGDITQRLSILRRDIDSADIAAIKAWYPVVNPAYGTDFEVGVMDSPDFFDNSLTEAVRYSFFLTDGAPANQQGDTPLEIAEAANSILFSNDDLTAFAFNIELVDTTYTAYMDNTPSDGVPVLNSSNLGQLTSTVLSTISNQIDLNAAHIIRECLTDSDWGLGYPETEIDALSFEAAASTLFDERMGLSLLWNKQVPIEDFVSEILRHIDGALYVSRSTGKFILKLIRDDYTVGTLDTFDQSNVSKITNFNKPILGELINSLTVNHWSYKTGEDSSVSVQDPALVQMQGAVINTASNYPGFTNNEIANKIATRDLKALSTPLIKCTIETGQIAKNYNIGDVFLLTWPDYEMDSVVMRVISLSLGNGVSNKIKIDATQDQFSFDNISLVGDNVDAWVPPGGPPLPVDYQLTIEAPYWALVEEFTQVTVDDELDFSADTGYIAVAGVRPLNGLSARLWTNAGAGYTNGSPLEFCPTALLAEVADYLTEYIEVGSTIDLDTVIVGTFAQIGDELVGILEIDVLTNIIRFERAILDTLPEQHAIGARVFFSDLYLESDGIAYVATEEVFAKILTSSSQGDLDINSALEESVVMGSRAIRPYPPGNIRINTEYYPTIVIAGAITVTWAYRDRVQQTAEFISFTETNIGPEEGTTYFIEFYNQEDTLVRTYEYVLGTSVTWDTEAADSAVGGENSTVRIRLYSMRENYSSYQVFDYTVSRTSSGAPTNTIPPFAQIVTEGIPINIVLPVITAI